MNYYLFFDSPTVKRTTRLLRGKDPVTAHINTIMDYTLYWFNGIYDYYLYTRETRSLSRKSIPRCRVSWIMFSAVPTRTECLRA